MIPIPNTETLPDERMEPPETDDTPRCWCGWDLTGHTKVELSECHCQTHLLDSEVRELVELLEHLRYGITRMHLSGEMSPRWLELTAGMLDRLAEAGIR